MSGSDKDVPSRDELEQMSTDELVKLGTNLDGVEIIHRAERYTEAGTKVEKRAERQVAVWFTIAGISALACLASSCSTTGNSPSPPTIRTTGGTPSTRRSSVRRSDSRCCPSASR